MKHNPHPPCGEVKRNLETPRVTDEKTILVAIPSLVSILLRHEQEKGAQLDEKEVLAIRDKAMCVALPVNVAAQMAETRGYDDIRVEHAWEDWCAIRPSLVRKSL